MSTPQSSPPPSAPSGAKSGSVTRRQSILRAEALLKMENSQGQTSPTVTNTNGAKERSRSRSRSTTRRMSVVRAVTAGHYGHMLDPKPAKRDDIDQKDPYYQYANAIKDTEKRFRKCFVILGTLSTFLIFGLFVWYNVYIVADVMKKSEDADFCCERLVNEELQDSTTSIVFNPPKTKATNSTNEFRSADNTMYKFENLNFPMLWVGYCTEQEALDVVNLRRSVTGSWTVNNIIDCDDLRGAQDVMKPNDYSFCYTTMSYNDADEPKIHQPIRYFESRVPKTNEGDGSVVVDSQGNVMSVVSGNSYWTDLMAVCDAGGSTADDAVTYMNSLLSALTTAVNLLASERQLLKREYEITEPVMQANGIDSFCSEWARVEETVWKLTYQTFNGIQEKLYPTYVSKRGCYGCKTFIEYIQQVVSPFSIESEISAANALYLPADGEQCSTPFKSAQNTLVVSPEQMCRRLKPSKCQFLGKRSLTEIVTDTFTMTSAWVWVSGFISVQILARYIAAKYDVGIVIEKTDGTFVSGNVIHPYTGGDEFCWCI